MDILNFHKKLIGNYKDYIQSFLNIKDKDLNTFVEGEISSGKLWPEPLIQFNPTFEPGVELEELVVQGRIHQKMKDIFKGYRLHRHQQEAILLGVEDKEFVVTSGTGSGKSLTYIATIFNHVLNMERTVDGRVQGIVVYPMNALINSQFQELQKFEISYLEGNVYEKINKDGKRPEDIIKELQELTPVRFPIRYKQYTGQEDETERDEIRKNPPHILLTNYMMLELMMTRGGKDSEIRGNILANMKYLVFDELHTYRGRQGSDVSVLIRRIKSAATQDRIICIGTSATMVSDDAISLYEQKQAVANVATTIFGSAISVEQIVNEYLIRSISGIVPNSKELKEAAIAKIDFAKGGEYFEVHPTAIWIEENIALLQKEERYVRRKPTTIAAISSLLAEVTDLPPSKTLKHLEELLEWANLLNSNQGAEKRKNYLPYRIHQFIAQTGSVYSTLGDQQSRKFFMDAGLYAENKDVKVFPLVFSRSSGHEFYCVRLEKSVQKIQPNEFYDVFDEESEGSSEEGYLFIQHEDDDELIWDLERDSNDLPESWFQPVRKDGLARLKSDREKRLPKRIFFDKQGNFSSNENLGFEGWFIPAPLMLDPSSGIIYESQSGEYMKVMKLGGEGRSTATTVLSFETILQLKAFDEPARQQKLLSFTDNRQDASLQAGHFNDFIKVGQLRSAIAEALNRYNVLDYTNIAERIFDALSISQYQFAKYPADFPGPKKENEDAFKDFITYRVLQDLKRSWRVVLPNLEQCGLLKIGYKYVNESAADNSLWQSNKLLASMSAEEREEFLTQLFDFFRKAYALSFSMLDAGVIVQNAKRIKEKLRAPWTLDDNERLDLPVFIRLEKLSSTSRGHASESGGAQSLLARYIKRTANAHEIKLPKRADYDELVYNLFDFLSIQGGWLSSKKLKAENGNMVNVYQLKADMILWQAGDGKSLAQDLVRVRSYKPIMLKPNQYFQRFYRTDFHNLKPIEGREHTGQISNEKRKLREREFRSGEISALFCSPTMELGIDIADLSIVHMRNVPPSPANYAQRSGRAGRSGQAALVMVYCSNFSAHDRHYFKHAADMVAGKVTAPRIDLLNQDLLKSHLYASVLTRHALSDLKLSIGDIVDTSNVEILPMKDEILESIKLTSLEKQDILSTFKKVVADSYFVHEVEKRKPAWFTDSWILQNIDGFELALDAALNRWRILYRTAQGQIKEATNIIENRVYADDHQKKKEAYRSLRQGERQRDLLLNKTGNSITDQSEFYPYRYLAAEGFLPGYNFTRLPIRSFMENEDQGGEFISRPKFVALSEFGPRNVIYHDGAKYRIDRILLSESELKLQKAKIAPKSGYFLYNDQYGYEVDPIVNEPLVLDANKDVHTTLIEMGETRAYEMQRITCQEEERTRKGYDIQTYFSVDGGFENTIKGLVKIGGEDLLHVHYIPACRIFKLNLKWRASRDNGFTINLQNGYWQNKKQQEEHAHLDEVKNVKLFTSDTANAIYLQPVLALGLKGEGNGVITFMYALKGAIERYFQVEANEIGATVMGDINAPNILIYESAEGSLGVLSQIIDNPRVFNNLIDEAYRLCFFKNDLEQEGELTPATYDDLLSYFNQSYHSQIDRNLIRDGLSLLKKTNLEILSNNLFDNYEQQYNFLAKSADENSVTEQRFLRFLFNKGLKLPDQAQPLVKDMFVRPDFMYHPNVLIFCDGTPHDNSVVVNDDKLKRETLKQAGYQVLVWRYDDDLAAFVARRPDIFKIVHAPSPQKALDLNEIYLEAKSKYSQTLKKLGQ
ncbi:hypothetical protein CA265_14105 [Sphingobacteriaceae bacterium GW460-11-11-14-LB5]|nr:hypothetical protein CA265_14105 [Sphingobacteriaceae bacterium GW460-11-11-14-LB5]